MTAPASTQADASAGELIRSLVPLGFATTLVGLTGAFITPFLPLFLSQTLHAGPGRTACFLFLTPLAAVVVASVVGHLSDRPGTRRRLLIVAAATGVAGFTLYALVPNYWALLAASVTLVAFAGSLVPQIFAYGREILDRGHPSRAAMGINALRMALSLSWAAGAPLGAFVIGLIDFRGLFLATAAAHLVMVAVFAFRKAPRAAPARESGGQRPTMEGAPSTATLLGTNLAFVVLQCATSLTVTTMPLFVSVDLHSTVSNAGLVLGLCAALEVPLMLVFGAFASRWPLRRLLLLGGAFGIAYCVVCSVAGSVWQIAAGQVLHACFVCTVGGLGISYFQELMPSALGRATTMFTNAGRISAMLAGLIFGLAQVHGYRLAYVVSIGLCVAGTAILAATPRRSQGRAPELAPATG